jgi:hypothetical protein
LQKLKLIIPSNRAKRYERMMRAHGIAPNAASIKPAPTRAPKSDRQDSNAPTLKKRKADQFLEDTAADDDEGVGWGSGAVHIKEGPREEKYNFKTEGGGGGGDHKPQIIQEQGQLNLEQAANLMQYYDNGSQLGVDDLYGAGEYGGGMSGYGASSGYATPMVSAYDLEPQNGYFGAEYDPTSVMSSASSIMRSMRNMGSMGGLGSVPRSSQQSFQYQQHSLPYQPEDQGHSDSPLIVE